MALATYADLIAAIPDWYEGRTDIMPLAPDFIALAEAEINKDLRVREMEAAATLVPDDAGEAELPDDYLAWRTVTALTSPRRELEFIAPSYLEDQFGSRQSGNPAYFTIRGDTITVAPIATSDVRLDYFAAVPALSDSAQTNWLLTKSPSLYLYLALKHTAIYDVNDTAAVRYATLAGDAMTKLVADDRRARFNRVASRLSGVLP